MVRKVLNLHSCVALNEIGPKELLNWGSGACSESNSGVVLASPMGFGVAGGVAFLALTAWLRQLPFSSEPILYSYLQIVGSLLCFTYAANAMVRFRGTHDRRTLILAFGFVLSGVIETVATFNFYDILASGASAQMRVPLAWMVSRTLLALVLIAALVVERRIPNSREPGREIAIALVVVVVVAYLTSAAYLGSPLEPGMHPQASLFQARRPAARGFVCGSGDCLRTQAAPGSFAGRPDILRGVVDECGLPPGGNPIRTIAGCAVHRGSIPESQQLRPGAGRRVAG